MVVSEAVAISPPFQINRHAAVAVHSAVVVVDPVNLLLDFRFLGIIIHIPAFLVFIVSIWADSQPL